MRWNAWLVVSLAIVLSACSGGGGSSQPGGSSVVPAVAVAPATKPAGSTPAPSVSPSPSPSPASGAAASILVMHAYDVSGNRLTFAQFRALQANGHGASGGNDAIVVPTTLQVRSMWPLYSSGGDPAIALPGGAASLALAWPSTDGYTNLVIDLPAKGGTVVFNVLAAQQAVGDLDRALAARPWYAPSAAFSSASATAHADLTAAQTATVESQSGALGAQAFNAAEHATDTLLAESGMQYAAAHRSSAVAFGVTLNDQLPSASDLQAAATVTTPANGNGWVRMVFYPTEPAAYYAAAVAAAHAAGLHVLGELLDSSWSAAMSLSAFEARTDDYVQTLTTVDEWEVGNEVNGNWVGTDAAAKIAYASQKVKATTGARTLVTLYWQLGEDDAAHSTFTWASQNLTSSIMANVDDIGLSLYPEDHPMGAELDRVMSTLHAQFASQHLMITELDYWATGLSETWWWNSQTDPTGAGRSGVAQFYGSAIYSFPYAGGGTFWWYFLGEATSGSGLQSTLESVDTTAFG